MKTSDNDIRKEEGDAQRGEKAIEVAVQLDVLAWHWLFFLLHFKCYHIPLRQISREVACFLVTWWKWTTHEVTKEETPTSSSKPRNKNCIRARYWHSQSQKKHWKICCRLFCLQTTAKKCVFFGFQDWASLKWIILWRNEFYTCIFIAQGKGRYHWYLNFASVIHIPLTTCSCHCLTCSRLLKVGKLGSLVKLRWLSLESSLTFPNGVCKIFFFFKLNNLKKNHQSHSTEPDKSPATSKMNLMSCFVLTLFLLWTHWIHLFLRQCQIVL